MHCFVPDGKRIIKHKGFVLINIQNVEPNRKLRIQKQIDNIQAGDEIILINIATNSVYVATAKLVIHEHENDEFIYKIFIHKLRKIGKNKPTAIRSLIFKTQIENLVDTYKPVRKPKKYHYKNIKNETYKGYGMRGLRKANQKEAYEREQAWLERLNNKKLWPNSNDN